MSTSPKTSKVLVVRGKSNQSYIYKKKKEERITRTLNRTIITPRGKRRVTVKPGDIIVTVTLSNGTVTLHVENRNYSGSNKNSKLVDRTNKAANKTSALSKEVNTNPSHTSTQPSTSLSTFKETPYSHWYRLNFIKAYVNAYNNNSPELNWYNYLLKNFKDKEDIWREIWPNLSSSNTPEKSALDHYYILNNNGVGLTNWAHAYDENATLEDLADIAKTTLAYKDWSLGLTLPQSEAVVASSYPFDVLKIIAVNPDQFRRQYEYANANNGSFDYSADAFDNTGLNVANSKYQGIGDFLDTYGLSPRLFYDILKMYYK